MGAKGVWKQSSLYTLLIAFFPLLSVYTTPITRVSIADALVLLIAPLLAIGRLLDHERKVRKIHIATLAFAAYVIATAGI